jgi:hypothetical protein
MIKLTVKQLLDASATNPANPGAGSALSRFFALDKPIAVAWKNRGQIKACTEAMRLYEEKRVALCEKYGKKNEGETQFKFDGGGAKAFSEELQELWKQEIDDLPGEPVKISSLPEGLLSESDLYLIEAFLTD